jgi:4-diphosphocytidyl-2-C-methyl-D-erythritol kinase
MAAARTLLRQLRHRNSLAIVHAACEKHRMSRLETHAPAKVNLTLSVLSRRADGYHELSSLVAFAAVGDTLTLESGNEPGLSVEGTFADAAGKTNDNLVLKAVRAVRARIENLKIGQFRLRKLLPAGAGLGGGSADAAAALRLIAQANELELSDRRLFDAALAVGADVPICLDPRARLMHGIGEILSAPITLPKLDAVLVFPDMPVATADVFGSFTLAAGARRKTRYSESEVPSEQAALMKFLASEANDLELAARLVAPVIGEARSLLEATRAPELVRMTGSGSALFAIYRDARDSKKAAESIKKKRPDWWVAATIIG